MTAYLVEGKEVKSGKNAFPLTKVWKGRGMNGIPEVGVTPEFAANDSSPKSMMLKGVPP